LAQAVNAEVLRDLIVPTISGLSTDPIPNIRFNVAKSMEQLILLMKNTDLTPLVNDPIKPALQRLSEDTDQDVRFFAQRALMAI
jgi:serine/threonine-protein phosphatase 2A regulatory subunit A